nr:MFS transporter permease [arsenite-oxidising bacterium NT-25]
MLARDKKDFGVPAFSREQSLEVFASYHTAVWPAQLVAYGIGGILLVVLLLSHSDKAGRLVAAGLAMMWPSTGIAYHGVYFSTINAVAPAFAVMFVMQAASLIYFGVIRSQLRLPPPNDWVGWMGVTLIVYSLIIYPLNGTGFGHRYPAVPTFGITPCPLTLFTFGVLCLATSRPPMWLLALPLLWSLIGGTTAFLLSVPQD